MLSCSWPVYFFEDRGGGLMRSYRTTTEHLSVITKWDDEMRWFSVTWDLKKWFHLVGLLMFGLGSTWRNCKFQSSLQMLPLSRLWWPHICTPIRPSTSVAAERLGSDWHTHWHSALCTPAPQRLREWEGFDAPAFRTQETSDAMKRRPDMPTANCAVFFEARRCSPPPSHSIADADEATTHTLPMCPSPMTKRRWGRGTTWRRSLQFNSPAPQ
jgi:hypothetical protein